ncbi:CBO0543 family protein [Alicyclobacillus sendaiensis]|uniref:CBO0543 family protein n=1 Tax=Alicyclobacillus sendaiensis TaxID=192387 RepID=UPI0026F44226|nr:CBO0543 family protein [Alicyclobacillus sendaiensis]
MVVVCFSAAFLAVVLVTRTHAYLTQYCRTVLWIAVIALMYNLVCRGYMMWYHPRWWFVTDKLSQLIQIFVLFPCTTLLFLRYMPSSVGRRLLHFALFLAVYTAFEFVLVMSHEIEYYHGWAFGWSILLDACMLFVMWLHEQNWQLSLGFCGLVTSLFLAWFHVPFDT